MRHVLTFLLLYSFTFVSAQQGVAINTDGSTPDPQAILDIKSINRGLLLPRMTTAQRNAISSPIAGLLVYDTDRQRIYQSDAGTWRPILNGRYWNRSASGNYTYNTEDSIGIGTATPDEKLEILNGKIKLNQSSNNTEIYNTINFNAGLPSGDYTRQQGLNFYTNGITKGKLNFISSSNNGNKFMFSVSSTSAGDLTINEEGHVGIGTQFPNHVLDINGVGRTGNTLRLAHAGAPIIQFAGAGALDKGFIQISGDDLRIGTNSENTAGKFIVRTHGYNQMEIDASSGSNIMRLYAQGVQRGSISALSNNNLSISTQNSNGLLILNGEIYINNSTNATGIGTITPDEKLHVVGNVKIENGELNKPATGTFNMMPLCYGRINANGTIHTATPNVSVTRTSAGTYEVNCSGITEGSVMTVTVYGSTRYIGSASYVSSGKMLVTIEDIKEVIDDPDAFHANDDKTFYFIIYNY
jgi:hypothetical protein